jgi:hypothetical protein
MMAPFGSRRMAKNTYVYLRGDSGYYGTPYRVIVAKHDAAYHPGQPWVNHTGDDVCDGGSMPMHWMMIIADEEET